MDENKFSITPSIVMEYLYCPRFIFYMKALEIPQNEASRFKVIVGREVHEKKATENERYLRKKLGVVKKLINQDLYSDKYEINGIIDEILFLEDGTAAVLDYKFAEYQERLFNTHKVQMLMYALLIRENFNVEVNKAYIVYTRSKNYLKEIEFAEDDFKMIFETINKVKNIVKRCYYPEIKKNEAKCVDCTYRNICV